MQRYFKILWRIARMSLATSLMYKTDWILGVFTTFSYSGLQIFFIAMLFSSGGLTRIVGFSVWQMVLVFMFGQIIYFFAFTFIFENVGLFRYKVMQGELDHFLLRPISPVFLLSFQKFGLVEASAIITYTLATLIYLFIRTDVLFSETQWLTIGVIFIGSLVLMSCIYWIAGLIFFYWPNFLAIWWMLNNISDVAKYPRRIYPSAMQWFLIFFIPLFCMVNPLYDVMDGSFDFWRGLDIFLVITMFVLIYLMMWKDGLRRYSSAA